MVLTDRALERGIVIPVGTFREQDLIRITKSPEGRLTTQNLGPVMFVPLVGQRPPGPPPE